jgi:alpha-tubulin suppressor-like RCC1 family protein
MSISAIVNKPTALVTINYPQGFAPSTGFGWGGNARGQIGDGSTTQRVFPVTTGHIFTRMDGGWRSSIGLKADGTIWCWGHNGQNQLGDGTTTLQNAPQKIPDSGPFVNSGFSDVMHGGFFAAAVKTNGEVWSWGSDSSNELGDDAPGADKSTPVVVNSGEIFYGISRAGNHQLARKL